MKFTGPLRKDSGPRFFVDFTEFGDLPAQLGGALMITAGQGDGEGELELLQLMFPL